MEKKIKEIEKSIDTGRREILISVHAQAKCPEKLL